MDMIHIIWQQPFKEWEFTFGDCFEEKFPVRSVIEKEPDLPLENNSARAM